MLINFEKKIQPPHTFSPPSIFIDFLNFVPPSTSHLLQLCTSFFQKMPLSLFIPTSTFIDIATFLQRLTVKNQ
jgi:hypothetical protein